MAINYNKSNHRDIVVTKGPRDRQLSLTNKSSVSNDSELVNSLKDQVVLLKQQLENNSTGFTVDQVNSEISKALKAEISILNKKHQLELDSLNSTISRLNSNIEQLESNHKKVVSNLNDIISSKDDLINQLKSLKNNIVLDETVSCNFEDDRPKMETVFVDPIEKTPEVETHIKVQDVSISKKEDMRNQVNKLKGLLGKLPNSK